jgi:hypothetical protein
MLLLIYWVPAYIWVLIWAINVKRKNKKVTDLDWVGVTLVFATVTIVGFFIFFMLPAKDVFNGSLF